MTALALALAGVPPRGLGLYARNAVQPGFEYYAIDPWRSNASTQVQQARAAGAGVWMFGGPSRWEPGTWRRSLAEALDAADQYGAAGVIVDRENGWNASHVRETEALGLALRAAATRRRIGVTSFPSAPLTQQLALLCGKLVWWSPQFYGAHVAPTAFGPHWARWMQWCGFRMVPSIAGWPPEGSQLDTPEGYASYLSHVPYAGGAIVWPAGTIPSYMRQQLGARYQGVGALLTLPGAMLAAADTWQVMLVLAVVLAVAVLSMVRV